MWWQALCFAFISSFKLHSSLMRWVTSASFYEQRNKGTESVSQSLQITQLGSEPGLVTPKPVSLTIWHTASRTEETSWKARDKQMDTQT